MFEVTVRTDFHSLLEQERLVGRTYRKWRACLFRGSLLLFGGFHLVIGLLVILGGGLAEEEPLSMRVMTGIILLWGLLFFLLGVFYYHRRAYRLRRVLMGSTDPVTLRFEETAFTETTSFGTTTQPYSVLDRLYAYHGRYFLFLDSLRCVQVPMDGFTRGASAAFAPFIQRVTGKPLKVLPKNRRSIPAETSPQPAPAAPKSEATTPESDAVYRFTLPEGYVFSDLVTLNRAAARLERSWAMMALRGFLCVAGGTLLLSGTSLIKNAVNQELPVWPLLLFCILGFAWLALGAATPYLSALSSRRMQLKDTGALTMTLGEQELCEESRKGTARYPYSALYAVARWQGAYLLFLDKKHAFILPENCRAQINEEAFQRFLEERTGKAVRILKK